MLYLLLALVIFAPPSSPVGGLDPGWEMILGKGLLEGAQFGKDLIFTYGPLGFFGANMYFAEASFWPLVLWNLAAALVFAFVVLRQAMRLAGWSRLLFLGTMLLVGLAGNIDAVHKLVIGIVAFDLLHAVHESRPRRLVPGALVLSVLSLVKFTNLALSGVVVACVAGYALSRRRFGTAATVLACFFGGCLVAWMACGQSLLNFPTYVRNSYEISWGYEQTMGLPTKQDVLWKGLIVLALLGAYLWTYLRAHTERVFAVAAGLILVAFTYFNWKHAFIRADGFHLQFFFLCSLLPCVAFPALMGDSAKRRTRQRWLLVAAGIACVIALDNVAPDVTRHSVSNLAARVSGNVSHLRHPYAWRQSYRDALRAERSRNSLPIITATVGSSSVDVLGILQVIAFQNSFNYKPRPIIQSYSAYTARLDRLNYDYYASGKAPQYALVRVDPIDFHFPTLDDAYVLRLLPHRYEYLLTEGENLEFGSFQLWRRRDGAFDQRNDGLRPLRSLQVQVGQPIDVGGASTGPVWAEIVWPMSVLGKIRNFFYKPPMPEISVTDDTERTVTYRLPIVEASAGFILSPLIDDAASYRVFAEGWPGRRVRSIRLVAKGVDKWLLAGHAMVQLSAITPAHR